MHLFLTFSEKDGSLSKASLEAVAAAKAFAQKAEAPLAIGILGVNTQTAADTLANCEATAIYTVTDALLAEAIYASDTCAASAICAAASPTLVTVPACSRWNRIIAGLAYRLKGKADTHITGLDVTEGNILATRWFYRQRLEGIISRKTRPWFLALEAGIAEAWSGTPAPVETTVVETEFPLMKTKFSEINAPDADQQTIRPDADLLFVAGAGWTKKQPDGDVKIELASEVILNFLKSSRASLGSTKSLVDLSGEGHSVLPFLGHMNQIGQTGSTPRHLKGLSTCCHGEEPHTVGWRFINQRRAISLDPTCGWAQGKADILYVADAFEVIEKLNELLAE